MNPIFPGATLRLVSPQQILTTVMMNIVVDKSTANADKDQSKVILFPELSSLASQQVHDFPRLVPATRFPAFCTRCTILRASQWRHLSKNSHLSNPFSDSRFSHDVTTAMLVPLNKEKAAMLVPRPNPPGI